MTTLSTRNVQAIVSLECHRVLREVAYEKGIPLKDLIYVVLLDFVEKVKKEKELQRTLCVPN